MESDLPLLMATQPVRERNFQKKRKKKGKATGGAIFQRKKKGLKHRVGRNCG